MQNGCMRLRGTIFCIPLLLAACGGTTVEVGDDALVAAEAEIAELEERLREQTESSDISAPVVSTTEVQVATTEVPENIVESWSVPQTGVSEGPCGVFRLNGTRILELEYDTTSGPYRWVDSGVDYLQMIKDWNERLQDERETWLQRSPDVAFAVLVDENRNHFFGVEWETSFVSLPEWSFSGAREEISGILGASTVSLGGFLGLDDNCDWGWVPIGYGVGGGASLLVINSSFSIEDIYPDGWVFVDFVWKDYSCEEVPPPGSTATYDPELHMFVSQCRDG